jgi:hypothetical protein
VSGKGDGVSKEKCGRVFDLVTSFILFAVIFAVVALWIYVFAVAVLCIFEGVKRLWWRWKAKRDDPLWRLQKMR